MEKEQTLEELKQKVNEYEKEILQLLQALDESNCGVDKYRSFFNNNIDALLITSPNGRILEVNSAACKMFGYTKEEFIKIGRNAIVDLDDKRLQYALEKRKRSGNYKGELTFKTKDGTKIPVEISSAIFKGSNDELQTSMIIHDLTVSKTREKTLQKSEGELRRNEAKLKFILDNLPDMVVEIDPEMKVLWMNKVASDLNPEAVGQTCYNAFPGNDEICTDCPCAKVFDTGKTEMGIMYQPSSKTAGESYWENVGMPLKDVDGNTTSALEVSRNVTDRELSRRRELKLQNDLVQSQKMESIGTLAGGIAHEFNNMLAIMLGNNELILEELPQESLARESAEEIRIAGLRARDVVKQLLTFSKQDDAIKKVMDFKKVVQESMKLIRSTTPANIKIEQYLSGDTYPVIGNGTQINQLFINLCNNAVDALPERGGIITVKLANETIDKLQTKHQIKVKPGQYAKLMVSDNGIGMDSDVLDRVFEPYFTTKDVGKGSGIGMAVVYGIVERHGGTILVDSKPGWGTTFTMFFPVSEGLFDQETEIQDSPPVGDEHILYVDDEPSIAKLGQRLLERLGYTTESITDPEKALDMVRNDPDKFDLLITDMAMPNMTGDHLVTEILKIRQDMPTIICTGYSAKISEKEAFDIGAHSYIMKPINKSELATMVRKVLDGAQKV